MEVGDLAGQEADDVAAGFRFEQASDHIVFAFEVGLYAGRFEEDLFLPRERRPR